jgi:hypothetical protein
MNNKKPPTRQVNKTEIRTNSEVILKKFPVHRTKSWATSSEMGSGDKGVRPYFYLDSLG